MNFLPVCFFNQVKSKFALNDAKNLPSDVYLMLIAINNGL